MKKLNMAIISTLSAMLMMCSCSLSEVFDNLPGETANMDNSDETSVASEAEVSAADTQNSQISSNSQSSQSLTDSKTSQDNSSKEEVVELTKPQALSVPENSYSAEYFLNGEDDNIRAAYKNIYEGIFNNSNDIPIPNGVFDSDSASDLLSLVTATGIVLDSPNSSYQLYVDNNDFVTRMELSYPNSKETADNMYTELMKNAQQIAADAEQLESDYDKIKYFHDTIINNCSYDMEAKNAHTAYGVLVEGVAVCEGYAKAFSLLCELSGIPSLPIEGTAIDTDGVSQSHMWNMVMCDGIWYNIDVTWDDPEAEDNTLRYDYFLISDENFSSSHQAKQNKYMTFPTADDSNGDYYSRNGLIINYDSDVYQQVYNYAYNTMTSGGEQRVIEFRCIDENLYEQVKLQFFTKGTDGSDKGFSELLKNFMQPGDQLGYAHSDNSQMYTFYIVIE